MSNLFHILEASQITDHSHAKELKAMIEDGKVIVVKKVWSVEYIQKLKAYLKTVAASTLPIYYPIERSSPNFHRMNRGDSRAYVSGCFHQFNFFPWNQDYFDLFKHAREIFRLKNVISGLPAESYLGDNNEYHSDFTARIAFQLYPAGTGRLNKHKDPVAEHQLALPTMVMSERGVDYKEGGVFFEVGGKKIFHEDDCSLGDIVFFDAQIPHGVDVIDPNEEEDWLSFRGRWMGLFSINKYGSSSKISNAQDLEKAKT